MSELQNIERPGCKLNLPAHNRSEQPSGVVIVISFMGVQAPSEFLRKSAHVAAPASVLIVGIDWTKAADASKTAATKAIAFAIIRLLTNKEML